MKLSTPFKPLILGGPDSRQLQLVQSLRPLGPLGLQGTLTSPVRTLVTFYIRMVISIAQHGRYGRMMVSFNTFYHNISVSKNHISRVAKKSVFPSNESECLFIRLSTSFCALMRIKPTKNEPMSFPGLFQVSLLNIYYPFFCQNRQQGKLCRLCGINFFFTCLNFS